MLKLLKQIRQSGVTSDAANQDVVINNVSANQTSPPMQPIRILLPKMSQPIRSHLQCSRSGYCYQQCLSQSGLTSDAGAQVVTADCANVEFFVSSAHRAFQHLFAGVQGFNIWQNN